MHAKRQKQLLGTKNGEKWFGFLVNLCGIRKRLLISFFYYVFGYYFHIICCVGLYIYAVWYYRFRSTKNWGENCITFLL